MSLTNKHILHVIQSAGLGGSEQVFTHISQRLQETGWTITCVLGEEGWASDVLRQTGVTVHIMRGLGCGKMPEFAHTRSLKRLIQDKNVQLVHTFQFPTHVYATLAAHSAGRPAIVNVRNAHHDLIGIPRRLLWRRLIQPLSPHYVAVSKDVKQLIQNVCNCREVTVITNGVDMTCYSPSPDVRLVVREQLGIPRDAIVIGVVANLRPVKGHVHLLRAAGMLSQTIDRMHVLLVGAEEEATGRELRMVCEAEGIRDRVSFLGKRGDVPDLLRAMDIFCLPSLSEGMSNALLQAMAAGLPVVATAVGGNPEVVVDGVTGYLVPAGSPSEMVSALLKLAQNPRLRDEMSTRARARIAEHFSLDRMVAQYADLYCSILDRAGT